MFKKQKYKKLFVALGLVTAHLASAQQLNFSDSWQLLQNKNNSLAAQRANVEHYQQLEKADNALNHPSITLGANYTHLNDDISLSGDDIYDSLDATGQATLSALSSELGLNLASISSTVTEQDMFNASIRALWPIYTGGRINAAQSYSAGRSDEATAQLKMETQARFEDLSQYYFSVVLAQQVLKTRQSVEQGLTQHRDFAIKLEQQGQIAKVERLQAEASLANAIVERKKAQRDVEITTTALTETLNQRDPVTPSSTLFINRTLPPLSAFTEQTLANYPGLDILTAKDKQAKSAIKAEKGKYYPEVYLYGDYTLYEDDSLASQLTPDWFVGIGVNIPLMENTGRSRQVQAAQSTVLQVRHLRQQAIQDLNVLVKKTYFQAQQAIEETQGLAASLALAIENLNLRKKSFNQGLATSLDVVDAQLSLAKIETQQQVARFNYIIALNKLLALSNQMSTFSLYESNALHTNTAEDKA